MNNTALTASATVTRPRIPQGSAGSLVFLRSNPDNGGAYAPGVKTGIRNLRSTSSLDATRPPLTWGGRFLFLAALLCSGAAHAQGPAPSLLDISGLAELVAEKAKETRAASLIDMTATFSGAVILPVWAFHATDTPEAKGADLVEFGIGGAIREGGHGEPLLSIALNVPGISSRFWDFAWAQAHIRRAKFPPVMIGPYIKAPWPGRTWVVGEQVGGMISIRIGGGP